MRTWSRTCSRSGSHGLQVRTQEAGPVCSNCGAGGSTQTWTLIDFGSAVATMAEDDDDDGADDGDADDGDDDDNGDGDGDDAGGEEAGAAAAASASASASGAVQGGSAAESAAAREHT